MEHTGPDAARAHLHLVPELFVAGSLDPGPVKMVTDVVAGLLVGRLIAPDWMATSQLELHLTNLSVVRDAGSGAGVSRSGVSGAGVSGSGVSGSGVSDAGVSGSSESGCVVVDAVVRRAGRSTVVLDASLSSTGQGTGSLGDARLTFVRLPRRDGNLAIADAPAPSGERVSMALDDSALSDPYARAIGIRDVATAPGEVELVVSPFVQNSFGAVNGGVVASLASTAAARAASVEIGGDAVALDVAVTYLAQGRVGPLRANATVLRRTGPTVLCRVEVTDPGQRDHTGDRVLVVAHVLCASAAEV